MPADARLFGGPIQPGRLFPNDPGEGPRTHHSVVIRAALDAPACIRQQHRHPDSSPHRHRDLEFSSTGKAKDELLRNFDQAIETVVSTIAKQSDEDWAAPYFGELESEAKTRFNAFLRCAGHAYHHVGQIIYLQRELLAGKL